jgi:hypothetical protein
MTLADVITVTVLVSLVSIGLLYPWFEDEEKLPPLE